MVIVIMGVSGSGKTTVGRALAQAVNAEFHDADDFHSPANVAKMRRGVPLTDADRAPWVRALRTALDEWLAEPRTCVLACSALTSSIRRDLALERPGIRLVFLHGDEALLTRRMSARRHFMPPELLTSQLALLEPPDDALVLDIAEPVDTLVRRIRRALGL